MTILLYLHTKTILKRMYEFYFQLISHGLPNQLSKIHITWGGCYNYWGIEFREVLMRGHGCKLYAVRCIYGEGAESDKFSEEGDPSLEFTDDALMGGLRWRRTVGSKFGCLLACLLKKKQKNILKQIFLTWVLVIFMLLISNFIIL